MTVKKNGKSSSRRRGKVKKACTATKSNANKKRKVRMNGVLIEPFLKWAGGKRKLVGILKEQFPESGSRFIEPFLGAGSVALNVNYPSCIVNDIDADLISVWRELKNKGMDFVEKCKELFTPENNTEERYYELRDDFNKTNNKFRKAVLFVYLNRHCYNGLCRKNLQGGFNSPIGRYKKPYFPHEEFEKSLEQVRKFDIYNKDFREIFEMVESGDTIYCDPPYVPISDTANFTSYSTGGFSFSDQLCLAECAMHASKKGATVVLSNAYNYYSKGMYDYFGGVIVTKLSVSRVINCNADKRRPVQELVVVFYPEK